MKTWPMYCGFSNINYEEELFGEIIKSFNIILNPWLTMFQPLFITQMKKSWVFKNAV